MLMVVLEDSLASSWLFITMMLFADPFHVSDVTKE